MSGTGKREVKKVMCSCGEFFKTPQALWDHHAKEERGIRDDLRGSAWRSLALELGEALRDTCAYCGHPTRCAACQRKAAQNPLLAKLTKMKGEG